MVEVAKEETFRVVDTVGDSPTPCLLWEALSASPDRGGVMGQ